MVMACGHTKNVANTMPSMHGCCRKVRFKRWYHCKSEATLINSGCDTQRMIKIKRRQDKLQLYTNQLYPITLAGDTEVELTTLYGNPFVIKFPAIYPPALRLMTAGTGLRVPFLDILIVRSRGDTGPLVTLLYDKRRTQIFSNIPIVQYQHATTCLPKQVIFLTRYSPFFPLPTL